MSKAKKNSSEEMMSESAAVETSVANKSSSTINPKHLLISVIFLLLIALSIWLILNSFEVFTRSPNLSRNTSVIANNQQIARNDVENSDEADDEEISADEESDETDQSELTTTANDGERQSFRIGNYNVSMVVPDSFLFADDPLGYSGAELGFITTLGFRVFPEDYPMQEGVSNNKLILLFTTEELKISYDGDDGSPGDDPYLPTVTIDGKTYETELYGLGDGSGGGFGSIGNYLVRLETDLYVSIMITEGARSRTICESDCSLSVEPSICVERADCSGYEDYLYYYKTSDEAKAKAKRVIESLSWEVI